VTDGAVILPEARDEIVEAPRQEWLPLLLLEIAGERYAIPNKSILELNVPGGVRSMPGAPPWILGLIDVRGTPMVAVSTASLLGRPMGDTVPDVCLIAELDDGFPIALFVDRALGLERVSPSVIFGMPQTMAGIAGYFVLGDDVIVGLIDPKQLVLQVEQSLRDAVPKRSEEEGDSVAADTLGRHQQLLTLRVGREVYGMTLDRIERIQASVDLTPLPSHVHYFDGMADVGDAIVPVIDLRRQQGEALLPFDATDKPPCILTMLEGALTGILVDQVLSILDIPPEGFEAVREASKLPISHIVAFEQQLISVLTIDRLLPRV
jgi:purine-binding chemotaxis protein CheW